MKTSITLPLRAVSGEHIRDWQQQYPDAMLSVEIGDNADAFGISEENFWEHIENLDWDKEGDDNAVLEPAIVRLAREDVKVICGFQDMLSRKLFELDTKTHAENIGEDAYSPDRYFSPDVFLYARCCVIANGRELFETVLKDPSQMPKDLIFGALLRLVPLAYEQKTGRRFEYISAYPIETYSNKTGWEAV